MAAKTALWQPKQACGRSKEELNIPGTKLICKLRDWIVKQYHALLQIRDKPHAIAGGVAVGIFFGFVFVWPKTAFALVAAWLLRVSKMAAVIAVTAHDLLLPVAPIYLRWEYIIGYWLLHHQMPPKLRANHHSFHPGQLLVKKTYLDWIHSMHENMNVGFFAHIIGPMLLGSIVLGAPIATICYFVVLRLIKHRQEAELKKEAGNAA